MLDPECAGHHGPGFWNCSATRVFSVDHPQVQKALRYLREEQEEDGSWYGRWGVNYIYGTWQVLRGFARFEPEHGAALDSQSPGMA